MSSLSKQPNGRYTFQFHDKHGTRKSVRLGKMDQRQAEAFKLKTDALIATHLTGHPPVEEVSRWVAKLGEPHASRLAAVGLIPKRENLTIRGMIEGFILGRETNTKPSTRAVWTQTQRNLEDYFGPTRLINSITAEDAGAFARHLRDEHEGEKLSEATARKRMGVTKQFFNHAVKREHLVKNPFADEVSAAVANRERMCYVPKEDAQRIIDACPDAEWQLIVAFARFEGLRCPSEILGLRWSDVDWENKWIIVRSPKTEHHAGKDQRKVPIFPEFRPHLEAAHKAATPGDDRVIIRHRGSNLGTQLKRIIRRAGVKMYPKPFQNLRTSCETDLAKRHGEFAACTWIGNSPAVARKHYLQVTEEDYKRAASGPEKAVQNPVQYLHETSVMETKAETRGIKETPKIQPLFVDVLVGATSCDMSQCARQDSNL